jgi:polyhydroxybutyrate depolymerase
MPCEGAYRSLVRLALTTLRAVAVLGIVALMAGCAARSPSSSAVGGSSANADTTQTPVPTPAVSPVEPRDMAIDVAGDKRTVLVLMPDLEPGERVPLLVMLHADGGSPFAMLMASGADYLAARERLIVLLPPARVIPSHGGRWDAVVPPREKISDSPDIAFLSGMLRWVGRKLPVDSQRVFVAGFSMGAVLADRMACQAADQVTGVAIDAGSSWSSTCDPARPVSVILLHGTSDNVFDFEDAAVLADRWREVDDCANRPESEAIDEDVVTFVNRDCAAGSRVELVRIEGETHRWFTEPSATWLAWQFFAELEPG